MKFKPGDIVTLKSAFIDRGQSLTVLECFPPEGPMPNSYNVILQSKQGDNMLTTRLPEFAIVKHEKSDVLNFDRVDPPPTPDVVEDEEEAS
jgi:hypothetical protein